MRYILSSQRPCTPESLPLPLRPENSFHSRLTARLFDSDNFLDPPEFVIFIVCALFGNAGFFLPAGTYKFRMDNDNTQYWTDPVSLAALQENTLNLDLDLMAANLTADPTYARYDGVAPEKKIFYLASSEPGILDANGADTGHAVYYFINDHLGSPVKVVDSQGQTVWSADFTPFGKAQNITGTYENRFRFPGQYYDPETGLHYNWHRYYDPDTGRYLTPDPIGLTGGINPFIYSENSPPNEIDPFGLNSFPFQSYVPPIAIRGKTDFTGNFTLTGTEAINLGTFPGAADPTAEKIFLTSAPIVLGVIIGTETGSVKAGQYTAWSLSAIINLLTGGPISEPPIPLFPGTGIEWINPPNLNESEPCEK